MSTLVILYLTLGAVLSIITIARPRSGYVCVALMIALTVLALQQRSGGGSW